MHHLSCSKTAHVTCVLPSSFFLQLRLANIRCVSPLTASFSYDSLYGMVYRLPDLGLAESNIREQRFPMCVLVNKHCALILDTLNIPFNGRCFSTVRYGPVMI